MIIEIAKLVTEPKLTVVTVKKGTPDETQRTKLSAAVAYGALGKSNLINIEAWGATAEYIADNFDKSDYIYIVGKLIRNEWTDSSGQKKYDYIIAVSEVRKMPHASARELASAENTDYSDDMPPEFK